MKTMNGFKILAIGAALIFSLGTQAATAKERPGGPGQGGEGALQGFGGGQGPGGGGPGKPHGKGIMGCVMKADLSTETLEAVQALLDADKEARELGRDEMDAARDAYETALTASEIDEVALGEAQDALAALHDDHEAARFALDRAVVDLLDDEELADVTTCLTTEEEAPEDGVALFPTLDE